MKPFILIIIALALVYGCEETVNNTPPYVTITQPEIGTEFDSDEIVTFMCEAIDIEDGASINERITWISDINGQFGSGQTASTSNLSLGTHIIIATATDSQKRTDADTLKIVIAPANRPPTVQISAPDDYAEFYDSDIVTLICTPSDYEDYQIQQEAISWTSDIDGLIGNGKSVSTDKLTVDLHKIWVEVFDSNGATASDTIHVLIKPYN